jgi:AcrR family transcriptional regulator
VELILASTAEILRRQGIGAVTTNSIAAEAGIPVSSIYQYFPSKVEILSALYEQYLAGIVAVIDAFATPGRLQQQPWEEFLTAFTRVIFQQETRERIDRELWSALSLFPELGELENAHRARMADRIADILRQLGSTWPRPRLRRIGMFIYELNNAVWNYRASYPVPARDYLEWATAAVLGVVRKCMPH